MVAIPGGGHKADIRQIVGRDWPARRKSATHAFASKGALNPLGLMSKGR